MSDRHDWAKVYPPGLGRAVGIPPRPLWWLLENAAARHGPRPAVYYKDLVINYERLWKHALSASAHMRFKGYGAAKYADRVLIWLPNCPEFITHYYGALRAGLIVTTPSPQLTTDEITRVIADTDPSIAVFDVQRVLDFDSAVQAAGTREPKTQYIEPGQEYRPGAGDSSLLQSLIEPPPPPKCRPEADVAVLQYTSGTTGGLKAAMMSHRNLIVNALQNCNWFGWSENDVVLGALPLCHTWGMCCVMNAAFAVGASIVLIEKFKAEEVLAAVARHKVTVIYGSGTMFNRLLDAAGADAAKIFASVRYVKAGAMLIGSDLPRRWARAVPHAPMINGYGLTEAAPEVTNNPPHRVKAGTVGVPLPGTDVRLCDPENPQSEVPTGDEGEVQVRGPQVMLGYWSRPDATKQALLEGGWLRTGDLGVFDDEGYLRIVDRLKDLIKFRGFSVYPAEIEKVLLTHPSIADAAVVGKPDNVDGEVPVAYVVLKPGAPADVADLPKFVEPHLADFKRPRRYHMVHDIPKNHVGKPLKRVLRELPE